MRAFIDDSQRTLRRPGLRATNGVPAPAEMREAREALDARDATGMGASARYDRYQSAQALASAATAPTPSQAAPTHSQPIPRRRLAHMAASARRPPTRAPYAPYALPGATTQLDPDVWLIALPNGSGGMRSLEGASRPGAIRVSRPYGHLRTVRPITPLSVLQAPCTGARRPGRRAGGDRWPRPRHGVSGGARQARQIGCSSAARVRTKLAAAQRDRASEGAGAIRVASRATCAADRLRCRGRDRRGSLPRGAARLSARP